MAASLSVTPLLTIGILFFFAKVMGILLKRVGVPTVVGEIIGGMIIGPFAIGGLLNQLFNATIINVDSTV